MTWKNSNSRYGNLAIVLHWLMAALILAVYALIELRELFPKGSEQREAMKALHFMLGLSVFLLAGPRLVAALSGPKPVVTPQLPAWQQTTARLGHLALYMMMFAMPLAGWLLLSAAGKPIPFFGLHLPALIGANQELAEFIKELHETGGEIGYFLIAIHAFAALYHHYVQHDDTLRRMIPERNID